MFIATLAWSSGAWGQTTSYVLNDGGSYELHTVDDTGFTLNLSGPGKTLTFTARHNTFFGEAYDYVHVEATKDDGSKVEIYYTGSRAFTTKDKTYTVEIDPANANINSIRFYSTFGSTLVKYISNIKVTRATTLSTSTSSLAFGDIHRITNKTKTLNASVSYNNTTYNQQIAGTNLPSCYSVTAQTIGETGTKNVPVICTATNSTALGAHNGNITLSMNGKTVTIPATANVVTTYYGQAKAQASVGGSAAVSFTSYAAAAAASTTSDDANTANTTAAKGSKTAYYKATVTNGYRFLGWIKGTDSYSANNVVSTALEYNPTIEYTSEDSSSPTVTTYKAWFAPMFYFSASAISSNETSGTATAEVAEEIQGNIGETSKSATATFTATPKENCTFEGWYSSDSYSGTPVSTSTTYTYTLSNNTIGSTTSKTFYALFKKNQK